MKKIMTNTLNVIHTLYCMICFCALDTPALFRWNWYWWILYYSLTLPLFIWGLVRAYKSFNDEVIEND